jgi:2-polyprenyl-6-methoxyphenol hydroxylase-like FAD-dependent oxidoreductase
VNEERYDVVIVGGRVAGSTLAALLGRRGLQVLLLENARFPSDTLSTHLIFGDSFSVWEEAGAWPAIVAIGAEPMEWIEWQRLPPATNLRVRIRAPGDHRTTLCLRRIKLDATLFENAARTPGVTAREGTRATELIWDRNRVVGVRYREEGGRGRPRLARAPLVVGADGRSSFVGNSTGAPYYNVVPPRNFPFYSYYREVEPIDPPAFQIWESVEAHGTVMLIPCDDDIWLGVVYTPQTEYDEFRRDHERLLEERMRADPRVGPRLARAQRIAPVRGRGDLVNFMRVPAGRGWALVGDAGQHKDPIFGQGIGDACRSAKLLAHHAEAGLGGDLDAALAEYHTYRDDDLLPKYDLMINGRATGVSEEDFDLIVREAGLDDSLAFRFVNIFTGGLDVHDVFNAAVVDWWKAQRPGRRSGRRAASRVTA